jgi:hypothetical protein
MVESLAGVVSGIGAKLKTMMNNIIGFAQDTLEAAKDKSISAIGAVAGTLHITEGLEAISRSLDKAADKLENAEQFHVERVEKSLLAEFEIPTNLESLQHDELKVVYGKLLALGMSGDLTATENAVVKDLVDLIDDMLPETERSEPAQELESEAEQGEEM